MAGHLVGVAFFSVTDGALRIRQPIATIRGLRLEVDTFLCKNFYMVEMLCLTDPGIAGSDRVSDPPSCPCHCDYQALMGGQIPVHCYIRR